MLLSSSTGLPNSTMSHLFSIPYIGSTLKKKKFDFKLAYNIFLSFFISTHRPDNFVFESTHVSLEFHHSELNLMDNVLFSTKAHLPQTGTAYHKTFSLLAVT